MNAYNFLECFLKYFCESRPTFEKSDQKKREEQVFIHPLLGNSLKSQQKSEYGLLKAKIIAFQKIVSKWVSQNVKKISQYVEDVQNY